MRYSKDWAIDQFAKAGRLRCRLFWGHRPRKDGVIAATCMSQWFASPFEVDGRVYATAEHWMMAEKARLFGDERALENVFSSDDPGKAKAMGRTVRGFDSGIWDARRFEIVLAGNLHKFSQLPELRTYLLETGDLVLVEASPVDPIWGTGLAADHEHADDPTMWPGENLLGFALMEVRDRLRAAV